MKRFRTFAALCLAAALLCAARAGSQSAAPAPSSTEAVPPSSQSNQSGYVLKVTTRLVTVDVIATDSRGNPVRDLKSEDFEIFEEHKAQQKIEHFQYFEKMKLSGAADSKTAGMPAPGILSNQLPLDRLRVPPTVLLMDSLNSTTPNQQQGRQHMIELMRTLPADTPIAVFLLGSSLRILQGFTSDPALLRAALDRAATGSTLVQDPNLDLQNTSSYIENTTAGMDTSMGLVAQLGEVENFEKEEYAMSLDLRAKETLSALTQIGQYLSGIPGRKNLIWVSESFPIAVAPDPDTGNSPFAGQREYTEQVRNVGNILTDAQVAVYPMDTRGLQANQSFAASENLSRPQSQMTGPQLAARLNAEDEDLIQAHATMQEIAQDTGGKACQNANDLAGCVMGALKDSSSYYELSFYPQNVNWDGKFHKITVKIARPGVKISYRRGYYAQDGAALAKRMQAEDHLRQACADQLPSTAIPLAVQAAPPAIQAEEPGALQYMLLISAAGLGSRQENGSYNFNVRVADCEFAQKDTIFKINERELPKSVAPDVYKGWQSTGIPYHVSLAPGAGTRRIRLAVLDVSSGLTGAVDIPVSPAEIAKVAKPPEPPPAPVATTPYVELPDKVKGSSEPKVLASLTFHLGASVSGTLDWSGDAVVYQTAGDMPLKQSAGGFSGYAFGGRFRCQSGHFAPIDSGDAEPLLRFTFHNHNGKRVVVDLKGDQPVYLGDLPIDPTAQTFFEQVWKTAHCQ